jgi:hypothetical protein
MGECTLQCTQFEGNLELHVILKVVTRKISHFELFLKSCINGLGFQIKRSHKNNEYEIDA